MNKEKINNIVILKNMPSNIVDEAILILKNTDSQNKKKVEEYAKIEGADLVEKYLKTETRKNSRNKIKIILGITFLIILFFIVKHIH